MANCETYALTGTQKKYLELLRNQFQVALSRAIDEVMVENDVPAGAVLSDDMTVFTAPAVEEPDPSRSVSWDITANEEN